MYIPVGLLLLLISGTPPIGGPEAVARILAKHAETLGDLNKWRNIQSVTYQLDIKEPKFHLQGVYRVVRSGKMRIDIFADGQHLFTEAFDGVASWQWQSGETRAKITTDAASAPLRHGIELPGHLFTLLDMVARGHKLAYLGDEIRFDKQGHLLQLTLKDGHQKYYFLHAETGEILAHGDQRAFHPDLDPTVVLVETRPEDYRIINGVRKPFKTINWDLSNDQWLGTTQILNIAFSEEIADKYFKPEHLEALAFPEKH